MADFKLILEKMMRGTDITQNEIAALDASLNNILREELSANPDPEEIKTIRCYFVGAIRMLVDSNRLKWKTATEIIRSCDNDINLMRDIQLRREGRLMVRFKKYEQLPSVPLQEGKIPQGSRMTMTDYVRMPQPKRILKNGPATIVFWDTGDKTIVKLRPGDADNTYAAFTAALAKKIYGNNSKVNRVIKKTEGK